jgi:hypothetical protein
MGVPLPKLLLRLPVRHRRPYVRMEPISPAVEVVVAISQG